MGLVNKDCDPSSNLGKLNIKLEPTQWNLFPPCWSSNKTRSECIRFDRGLANYSNENENLIIILHGFGGGPESFYDLPKHWKTGLHANNSQIPAPGTPEFETLIKNSQVIDPWPPKF